MRRELVRKIRIPQGSALGEQDYKDFLENSYHLMAKYPQYFSPQEDINCLELAHLIPSVPETVLAVYIGLNDAVCNKGLVTAFLPRHAHNNVFVFDAAVFAGGADVPAGTIDARKLLNGFEPPNKTWDRNWTYVMIEDPARTSESLWAEDGYIDMVPAKFEDFTVLSEPAKSRVCIYIDEKAFEHPVNMSRGYLQKARQRGEKMVDEFEVPTGLEGEVEELVPVVLDRGEKLYVARPDFGPCAHAWSNIHPGNSELAVVNENSAIALDLVVAKPAITKKYAQKLIPPKGSSDMTTDWFYRGQMVVRTPLLEGAFRG
jgi:hypothetical protein